MNARLLSFTVALDYGLWARASRGVFVPVTLTANAVSARIIDARVDSASTQSVFGRQWAEMLDLDWDAGDRLTISTAAGAFQGACMKCDLSA